MPLAKMLAEAATLSDSDLAVLVGKLQALRSLGSGQSTKKKEAAEGSEIYAALAPRIYQALGHKWPPYAVFLKSRHGPQFQEADKVFQEWLAPLVARRGPAARASIIAWVADMAVGRIPLYANMWFGVIDTLKNIPQLVDKQLPGYAASGLLPWAVNARVGREKDNVRRQPDTKTRAG